MSSAPRASCTDSLNLGAESQDCVSGRHEEVVDTVVSELKRLIASVASQWWSSGVKTARFLLVYAFTHLVVTYALQGCAFTIALLPLANSVCRLELVDGESICILRYYYDFTQVGWWMYDWMNASPEVVGFQLPAPIQALIWTLSQVESWPELALAILRLPLSVSSMCVVSLRRVTSVRRIVNELRNTLRYVDYKGVHDWFAPRGPEPVLHPVNEFGYAILCRWNPARLFDIRSRFKRVSPTSILKAKGIAKYEGPELSKEKHDEVMDAFRDHARVSRLWYLPGFAAAFCWNVFSQDYDATTANSKSSAGFPFQSGVKKQDVWSEIKSMCDEVLSSAESVRAYFMVHIYSTTGRAKFCTRAVADSARLVLFPGAVVVTVLMLYFTPLFACVATASATTMWWCGIGFSWSSGGATRLANYIGLEKGFAARGRVIASTDASNWDAGILRAFQCGCRTLHWVTMQHCFRLYCARYIPVVFVMFFFFAYKDGMYAVFVIAGGHMFMKRHGVINGFGSTGFDNCAVNTVMKKLWNNHCDKKALRRPEYRGYKLHVVHWYHRYVWSDAQGIERNVFWTYGDDFVMNVPVDFPFEEYMAFNKGINVTLKFVHYTYDEKYYITHPAEEPDADVLSYIPRYDPADGQYYPWRPADECIGRAFMPEDMSGVGRTVCEAVATAEVWFGQKVAFYYNKEVRDALSYGLNVLRKEYGVTTVDTESGRVRTRVRNVTGDMRAHLPTDMPKLFFENIYQKSTPQEDGPLAIRYPNESVFEMPVFDAHKRKNRTSIAPAVEQLGMFLQIARGADLGDKLTKASKRALEVFKIPQCLNGKGGAKYLELTQGEAISSLLIVGSDPGSDARAAHDSGVHHIDAVSKKAPDKRVPRDFMYKTAGCDPMRLHSHECVVQDFRKKPHGMLYDCVMIDCYDPIYRARTESDIPIYVARHAKMQSDIVDHVLPWVRVGGHIHVKLFG